MIRFRLPPAWRAPQCRTGPETSRVAISDGAAALASAILHPVSTEPATTATPVGSRRLCRHRMENSRQSLRLPTGVAVVAGSDLDSFAHVKDERLRRLL